MQGPRAERFVVLNLRLLAVTFAVVGILFVAGPSGVLDLISDVGEWFGSETRAPHTQEYLWLALAFAYMVVITSIALLAATDVVRYRALLLVLAAGKTASSLGSLAFFLIQDHVFIYLLNFLVDGFLALLVLWLWVLTGRIGRRVDPG
jgi:nitric oxide reductase large subunit